jgi:hypothetical protein
MHPDVLTFDTFWDVMIRCPDTGKAVHTCLALELDSWAAIELPAQRVSCPECGKLHKWEKADAWLHKERPQPEA